MANQENRAMDAAGDFRLGKFKTKMSALRNLKPLKDLCIASVNRHFMCYSHDSYHLQLKLLPASLRQDILKKMVCYKLINPVSERLADALCRAIIQLLDHQIKSLNNRCLSSEHFQELDSKLMDALIEKATGLQELAYSCNTSSDILMRQYPLLCEERLNKLTKMRSLQVLSIHQSVVNDACLDALGQNLSNLVILKADLSNVVSSAGIKSLKSLKKLREFWFRCYGEDSAYHIDVDAQAGLMGLCLKHLPQLVIAGYAADKMAENLSYHAVRPDMDEHSMLEHLLVRFQLSLPQAQLLPFVKHLEIESVNTGSDRNLEWLLSFEKLESLHLKNVSSLDVIQILGLVGGKLKKLNIRHVYMGEVDLWHTLSMCPNLELFYIDNAEFTQFVPGNSTLPSGLRVARFSSIGLPYMIFPDLLFPQLMSLPLLREVDFDGVLINPLDVHPVTELVKAGAIFQQLNFFKIVLPISLTTLEDVNACGELLKNVCAFAPKLSEVAFRAPSNEEFYSPELELFVQNMNSV